MWNQINEILNQSATRAAIRIADFLPGLLALILVLLISIVLAWVVSSMLRRSLQGIQFDRRLDQWGFSGVSDWSPAKSPTLLVARVSWWSVMLLGFLLGMSALDADLTSTMVRGLFAYLPDLFAAFLVLVVGTFIARFLARGVLISAVNMQIQSARFISLGVKWLLLVLTGAMALQHLHIGGNIVQLSFAILFGGIVLALALAVGLGSKDMIGRAWERQVTKTEEETEDHFQHL